MACIMSAKTSVTVELQIANLTLMGAAVEAAIKALGGKAGKMEQTPYSKSPCWDVLLDNRRFLVIVGGRGLTVQCESGYAGQEILDRIAGSIEGVFKGYMGALALRKAGYKVAAATGLNEQGRAVLTVVAQEA